MMNVNWERLWRASGIAFVVQFIIAYVIYGDQPKVGASAGALVSFYDGDRGRVLIAAVFSAGQTCSCSGSPQPSRARCVMPAKAAGARRRPPPTQRWPLSSSCSSP
jgi:hypothetical protein